MTSPSAEVNTIEMVKQLEKKKVATPLVFLIDSFWKPEDLGLYLHFYNLRKFGINYLVEKFKNNFSDRREKTIILARDTSNGIFFV